MTRNEFAALCLKLMVDPYIALENEGVVKALKEKNDREVIEIMVNDF